MADTSRLQGFESEIRQLGIKGGEVEPERRLVLAGLVAAAVGIVLLIVGYMGVRGSSSELGQGDNTALMLLGLGIGLMGIVVWARYSLSRYLRYWLIRQIFEDRAQTDRIVDAVGRRGSSAS